MIETTTPVLDMVVRRARDSMPARHYDQFVAELTVLRNTYNVLCPDCEHHWGGHVPLGCQHGWVRGPDGIHTVQGCSCQNRRGGVWAYKPAPGEKEVTMSQIQSTPNPLPPHPDADDELREDSTKTADQDPDKDNYGGGVGGAERR